MMVECEDGEVRKGYGEGLVGFEAKEAKEAGVSCCGFSRGVRSMRSAHSRRRRDGCNELDRVREYTG